MGEIPEVDLLGDPLRELQDPRGRKKHRITLENRNKVSALRAAGMSRADISDVLGISPPTLAKYYFSELTEGVARERALAFGWLRKSAEDGNVSAQKAWIKMLEDGRATPPVQAATEEPVVEDLGKKAKAIRDAKTADRGSAWGDLVKH